MPSCNLKGPHFCVTGLTSTYLYKLWKRRQTISTLALEPPANYLHFSSGSAGKLSALEAPANYLLWKRWHTISTSFGSAGYCVLIARVASALLRRPAGACWRSHWTWAGPRPWKLESPPTDHTIIRDNRHKYVAPSQNKNGPCLLRSDAIYSNSRVVRTLFSTAFEQP